jgi:hypothetical protein
MTRVGSNDAISTFSWWEAKRKRYNIGLIIAGISAFTCYVIVASVFSVCGEVTIFTTIFQGVGYLLMMLVANICYFLGPISESILRPKDVNRFRKISYGLGFWFSFALPFSVPIAELFSVEIVTFLRSTGRS